MKINYFIDKTLGIDRSFLYRRIADGPLELFSRQGYWMPALDDGNRKIRNIKIERYIDLLDKNNPYDVKVLEWNKTEFYKELLNDG